jgi:hypothetical protein
VTDDSIRIASSLDRLRATLDDLAREFIGPDLLRLNRGSRSRAETRPDRPRRRPKRRPQPKAARSRQYSAENANRMRSRNAS